MSEQQSLQRPRQVTLAAGIIVVGSVFVVLSIWDQIVGLRSLASIQEIEKFLSEPPGDRLDVGVDGVVRTIRIVLMVAAGCATAAAILGVHVWKRNRQARLALTILALPLFLTGLLTATFLCSAVAAASVMLWLQPARDWFDGRAPSSPRRMPRQESTPERQPGVPPREEGTGGERTSDDPSAPPSWPVQTPSGRPLPPPYVPHEGPGQQGVGAPQVPPSPYPFGHPDAPAYAVLPRPVAPQGRPASVTVACAVTWVCSGVVAVMMAAVLLMLATAPASVFDEVHRQNPDLEARGITDAMLRDGSYAVGGLLLVWCVAGVVLAVLVFRRRRWAWTALVASTVGVLVLSLLTAVASVMMVLPALAAGFTLVALLRPESRAWFAPARRLR